MTEQVILVVVLRRVEALQRIDARDDGPAEYTAAFSSCAMYASAIFFCASLV